MSIGLILSAFLSGAIGAMGLGGGGVFLIYLTVFAGVEQIKAQGMNLMFFIPSAIVAIIVYSFQREICWKITLSMAFWGLIGAFSGWFLTDILGGKKLSAVFAIFLITLGTKQLFAKEKPNKTPNKN